MSQQLAVWLSRHPLPADLCALIPGCQIIHVRGRWQDAEDAYLDALLAAKRVPDVLFFITPRVWRDDFVRHVQRVSPSTLLIRPILTQDGTQRYWVHWFDARHGRVRWQLWEGVRVR